MSTDRGYPLAGRVALYNGVTFEGYNDEGDDRRVTTDIDAAQVATSQALDIPMTSETPSEPDAIFDFIGDFAYVEGGYHYPVLDLDMPATLVPSSTQGHAHLYIDHPVPWSDYCDLLRVLAKVGLLEEGYVSASIARGFTSVRLPWVSKSDPLPSVEEVAA